MTVWQAREYAINLLKLVTDDEALVEAGIMLSHVLGLDALELMINRQRELSAEEESKLKAMLKRRMTHEPLQYILGRWELMGLEFIVERNALIPRSDTETVIENALNIAKKNTYKTVLDLCCGTGCIGISLAYYGGLNVTMADISRECIELANKNASINGVQATIMQSDMFSRIDGTFDMIVCNPPYIKTSELNELQAELSFEPRLALDGGDDGLVFYRRIASGFEQHLNAGGAIVLEIGRDQADSVISLFKDSHSPLDAKVVRDISGNDRCIIITINREQGKKC